VHCVVCHQVVLDGVHVDEDERGVHHPSPELGAGVAEQRVEALGGGVVGVEAAVGVQVGVVVPREGQLLRQAAQRARAVDPELAGPVRVQRLCNACVISRRCGVNYSYIVASKCQGKNCPVINQLMIDLFLSLFLFRSSFFRSVQTGIIPA